MRGSSETIYTLDQFGDVFVAGAAVAAAAAAISCLPNQPAGVGAPAARAERSQWSFTRDAPTKVARLPALCLLRERVALAYRWSQSTSARARPARALVAGRGASACLLIGGSINFSNHLAQ